MKNSKSTTKKKYQKNLQKLILNIEETVIDFLPDRFCSFKDQRKQQVKGQLYCCVMLQILEKRTVNNWSKNRWTKNYKTKVIQFFKGAYFRLIFKDGAEFMWKYFIPFFTFENWREKLTCLGSLWNFLFSQWWISANNS